MNTSDFIQSNDTYIYQNLKPSTADRYTQCLSSFIVLVFGAQIFNKLEPNQSMRVDWCR